MRNTTVATTITGRNSATIPARVRSVLISIPRMPKARVADTIVWESPDCRKLESESMSVVRRVMILPLDWRWNHRRSIPVMCRKSRLRSVKISRSPVSVVSTVLATCAPQESTTTSKAAAQVIHSAPMSLSATPPSMAWRIKVGRAMSAAEERNSVTTTAAMRPGTMANRVRRRKLPLSLRSAIRGSTDG